MEYYIKIKDIKIECIYNYDYLLLKLTKGINFKELNNAWINIIHIDFCGKESNSLNCFIELSALRGQDLRFVRFKVLYSFHSCLESFKWIAITAEGLTNFFNKKPNGQLRRSNKHILYEFKEIKIGKKTYTIKIVNNSFIKSNLNYADPTEVLTSILIGSNQLSLDDFTEVVLFVKRILQFATFNTNTEIKYLFLLDCDNNSVQVDFDKAINRCYTGEKYTLSFSDFLKAPDSFFDFFNHYFYRPHFIYYNYSENVYDKDIPAIIGEFEDVFNRFVSKDEKYRKRICNVRKLIHYDEIKKYAKKINKYKVSKHLNDFYATLSKFSISLGEKIKSISTELLNHLEIGDNKIYKHNIAIISNNIAKSRNSIVHGRDPDFKSEHNCLLAIDIIQADIYYIIFKYVFNLDKKTIKRLFRCYYFDTLRLDCLI